MKKKAALIIKDRTEFEDGSVMEIKLWQVPPSDDKPHGYKYSLVYIVKGRRIIGYDNAEGKGDHRHLQEKEESYKFKDVDRLLKDFLDDVTRIKGGVRHEDKKG